MALSVPLFLILGGVVSSGVGRLVSDLMSWPGPVPATAAQTEKPLEAPLTLQNRRRGLALAVAVLGATGGLCALAGVRYDTPAHVALVTIYGAALVICAATDLLAYRVPNIVTYPAIVLALSVGLSMPGSRTVDVLGGGVLAGAAFLVPALLTRGRGIGMGDVKLALFVGLALGLGLTPAALLITAVLGGLVAAMLLTFGLRHRQEIIPYAPFVAVGAITVLFWRGAAFGGAG